MGKRDKRAAQALRRARLERGYTQQGVSAMASISVKAYQRLEYGERDIGNASMRVGLAVCLVLELDPFALVLPCGADPKNKYAE